MILEAFSQVLHQHYCYKQQPALVLLYRWLLSHLLAPDVHSESVVHRVIVAEIELLMMHPTVLFQGRSDSGERLLKSLFEYCESYENWQYRRWLHTVHASDF